MQAVVPLACFLSMIRPPGVQYENALLQIAPVDKSKCPYIKENNDVGFQLFTRHNPTVYQELILGDDEKLFASNIDFNDNTVLYFHAWMEQPDDGSGIMVREAYMQRGDTNVIMVDAHHLEAGPWYFTAAQNTWYIGRFAAQFVDYLASRGLNLNKTHLIGHSLGAHAAGVAGSALKSGRVARITGLDPALPLFDHLPLEQRLDTTDAHFVDIIHTDAGIFGYKAPMGHVDFYPNGGISPQPGCELEVVLPKQLLLNKFFCSHWRSYMFYTESVLRPTAFVASQCPSWKEYKHGECAHARTARMGHGVNTSRTQTRGFYSYYLSPNQETHLKRKSLESKLEKLFAFIQSVKAKNGKLEDMEVDASKVAMKFHNDVNHTNDTQRHNTDNTTVQRATQNEPSVNNTKQKYDSIKDVLKTREDEDKIEELIEDQIAEASEYDLTLELNQDTLKDKETVSIIKESEEFVLEDDKTVTDSKDTPTDIEVSETQDHNKIVSVDTVNKKDAISFTLFDAEATKISEDITTETLNKKHMNKRASNIDTLNYKDPCKPKKINVSTEKPPSDEAIEGFAKQDTIHSSKDIPDAKPKEKPKPINILNVLQNTYRISRVISTLKQIKNNNNKSFSDKLKKFLVFKENTVSTPTAMTQNTAKKNQVIKRQKRFLPFLTRNENEPNNILFRMLDFLIKNRKNVLPVFTVMREINTLVKSANGELNHFTKEQNNYIGATPPVLAPISYSLELGNENKATAFIKRLLGMAPKGDRLTING